MPSTEPIPTTTLTERSADQIDRAFNLFRSVEVPAAMRREALLAAISLHNGIAASPSLQMHVDSTAAVVDSVLDTARAFETYIVGGA